MHIPYATGARAATAGRWLGSAMHLLVEHPAQEIVLESKDGVARATVVPRWTNGTPISAHQLLKHHQVYAGPDVHNIFQGVQGTLRVRAHVLDMTGTLYVSGEMDVAHGASQFQTTQNDSCQMVAQAFGLLCEALGDPSPFHHALLWALVGQGSGGGQIHFPSLNNRLSEALDAAATLPRSAAPVFGVRAPYVTALRDLAWLPVWLEKAAGTARASSEKAFLEQLAVHMGIAPRSTLEASA